MRRTNIHIIWINFLRDRNLSAEEDQYVMYLVQNFVFHYCLFIKALLTHHSYYYRQALEAQLVPLYQHFGIELNSTFVPRLKIFPSCDGAIAHISYSEKFNIEANLLTNELVQAWTAIVQRQLRLEIWEKLSSEEKIYLITTLSEQFAYELGPVVTKSSFLGQDLICSFIYRPYIKSLQHEHTWVFPIEIKKIRVPAQVKITAAFRYGIEQGLNHIDKPTWKVFWDCVQHNLFLLKRDFDVYHISLPPSVVHLKSRLAEPSPCIFIFQDFIALVRI